jgi:hypothetical protein
VITAQSLLVVGNTPSIAPAAGPPNGASAVTGADIAHFKDGRIQALYVFLDPAKT